MASLDEITDCSFLETNHLRRSSYVSWVMSEDEGALDTCRRVLDRGFVNAAAAVMRPATDSKRTMILG